MPHPLVRVEDVDRGWARYSIATFDLLDRVSVAREIERHGVAVVVSFAPARPVSSTGATMSC